MSAAPPTPSGRRCGRSPTDSGWCPSATASTTTPRSSAVHSCTSSSADGTLPLSYATDDGTGVLYEGEDPVAVIEDTDGSGKAAYRVELVAGEVVETRLEPGPIA